MLPSPRFCTLVIDESAIVVLLFADSYRGCGDLLDLEESIFQIFEQRILADFDSGYLGKGFLILGNLGYRIIMLRVFSRRSLNLCREVGFKSTNSGNESARFT